MLRCAVNIKIMSNNQNKSQKQSFMADILNKACDQIGAELLMGPKLGASGQICFPDNKRVSFFNCCFDINGYGSSLIARNKGLARLVLEKEGIRFPQGAYFSLEMDRYRGLNLIDLNSQILAYANNLGFPVMLKGADLHRGTCVYKADNEKELLTNLSLVWAATDYLVLEKYLDLRSYRLLVFDGEIVAAYEKVPLSIIGDGKKTVRELIDQLQDNDLKINLDDSVDKLGGLVRENLNKLNIKMDQVIDNGRRIPLLDTCNISTGGQAIDCIKTINKDFVVYVSKIMKILNLRFAGIDILSSGVETGSKNAYLLEINSSPSLETYGKLGDEQREKIQGLIKKIILEMKKI